MLMMQLGTNSEIKEKCGILGLELILFITLENERYGYI